MARDNFLKSTIDIIRDRVNNFCSNPACKISTRSAHSLINKTTSTGIAAHICAASKNGPRYDKNMTVVDRVSGTNCIWLCCNCATMIDKDHKKHPVELIFSWKTEAEKRVSGNHGHVYLTSNEAKDKFELQLIEKKLEFSKLLNCALSPTTEIETKLEDVEYKLKNIEASYDQEVLLRKEIEETLYTFKNKLPYDAFYKATNLLYEGQTDYAEKILNEFIDDNESNMVKAYIASGKISEMKFDYKKAFKMYEKASVVSESQPHIINHAAQLAYRVGLYKEAFALLERGINDLDEDVIGKAIYINQKGLIYRSMGDYKNAISSFEESLALVSGCGSQGDELNGIFDSIKSNLALVYIDQGKYSLGMDIYKELIKSDTESHGSNSLQVCCSLSAIGTIHEKNNNIPGAIESYEKAYDISVNALGKNHPGTITHLNNLALSYISSHPKKSEKMFKGALKIRLEQYGEKHLLTATVLSNLASCYAEQNKDLKSKKSSLRALAIMLDCHDEKHPQALRIRHNLALIFSKLGNKDKAIEMMACVADDRKNILGHDHPLTKLSIGSLSQLGGSISQEQLNVFAFKNSITTIKHLNGQKNS
ncbi:MAG: tetratricopeptide repeat protein [Saprospiraceae bacterium]|nr:tetratricopeptide repeat protein [Saprospiraceae bacterium]